MVLEEIVMLSTNDDIKKFICEKQTLSTWDVSAETFPSCECSQRATHSRFAESAPGPVQSIIRDVAGNRNRM